MIKLLILCIIFNISLNAFKIEVVENKSISNNEEKHSYTKNSRIILNPINKTLLKPMYIKLLHTKKLKVLKPYNPILEKKIALQNEKSKKIAIAKKEAIKKQFAKPIELKVTPVKKEQIKTQKESTEFFNTLNSNDSQPINME